MRETTSEREAATMSVCERDTTSEKHREPDEGEIDKVRATRRQ